MQIVISGGFRTGKTYLGKQLSDALNIQDYAYADYLKILACRMFPDKISEIYAETKTPETRELLMDVRDKVFAEYDENFFIDFVHNKMKKSNSGIITDCRFYREMGAVSKDFPDAVWIMVGETVDEYDVGTFYKLADIHLPAKPITTITGLNNLCQQIKEIANKF